MRELGSLVLLAGGLGLLTEPISELPGKKMEHYNKPFVFAFEWHFNYLLFGTWRS